jgi:hypothetical protein
MTIATQPDSALPNQTERDIELPYPPSWMDRLIAWIEHLPLPSWFFYLIVLLIGLLIEHIIQWMDGSLPMGSISPALLAEAPFLVFAPAVYQYLNTTALQALREFRPALQIDDAQYAILEYRITTVPARPALIATILSVVLAAINLLASPAAYGISSWTSTATATILALFLILQAPFYLILIYHSLRQLSLVASIHAMVKQINLFQLFPVYAFSSLTARTGLAIILLIYYSYFFFYDLNVRGSTPGFLGVVSYLPFFLVALACFVLPLLGMHHRLAQEKSRLLAESNRRLELALSDLHERIDGGEYDKVDIIQKTLSALRLEHDVLEKISTWPWKTETLRSFLTIIALPIIMYLISRFIGRLVGL